MSKVVVLFGVLGVVGLIFSLLAFVYVDDSVFSGSYLDLSDVPVVDYSGFANDTDLFSGDYGDLSGVPDLSGFGSYDNLTGVPVIDLMHGLCCWLPFDGLVIDRSGYVLGGTATGGSFVSGKFDRAVTLSGSVEYVSVNDNNVFDFVSAITVSAWVNFDTISASRSFIVSRRSSSVATDVSFYFALNTDGTLRFYSKNTGGFDGNTTLTAGNWYHVVFWYDGSSYGFVVNGVSYGSGSASGALLVGAYSLEVGRSLYVPAGTYWDGEVDDVRVYNRALSGYEISALYGLGV